jgi:pimeloyl-ACP methyl ester carboxylesterase
MTHQHEATAADGTTIAWSRFGSGDPVVVVHGITESASSWQPITDRLATTNEVVTLDLRGHGESGRADSYDLVSMAGDVATVIAAAELDRPHVVGHSLGGMVATAAGSMLPFASIVNVDQSLQLASFKSQLMPAEALLRDPDQYQLVVDAMFDSMMGERMSADEAARINGLRHADHDVVLGVWELLLTEPEAQIVAIVDAALAGYAGNAVPYLALFGIDPGDDYPSWLSERIVNSTVEYWPGHGHYPHLVDPDSFVARLHQFWE